MILGSRHSKETKRKMSIAYQNRIPPMLGKHHSEETKKKIKKSNRGKIPWNRNKHWSEEIKQKISKAHIGKIISKEAKEKMSEAKRGEKNFNYGKHLSEKIREKISEAKKDYIPWNKGKIYPAISNLNHWNWKDGISPLNNRIRNCFQYRQWRSDVFTRDNFTCQICGRKGHGDLNAHHIKNFSTILQEYEITTFKETLKCEELWNINNGITYCKECHQKTYGRIKNDNKG